MGNESKQFRWFTSLVWYGLGVYLALSYIQGPFFRAWRAANDFPSWVSFAKACLALALLGAFFVLIYFAVDATMKALQPPPQPPVPPASATALAAPQTGEPFPSKVTVVVGVWLLILAAICVTGLFFAMNTSCWPEWLKRCVETDFGLSKSEFAYASVTMFGAGVGSIIATILGYLEHASEKKDFERAYAPWYVGRPLMGLLLGLVFYFLLRGGLLVVTQTSSETKDLNVAGLAGVGGLVGLFSKQAIEKLQDVFDTLFSSKKGPEQAASSQAPPDQKK